MTVDGMSHISEIMDGWETPPWMSADGTAGSDAPSPGAASMERELQGWRVGAAGALVLALSVALFLVGRSSGEVTAPAVPGPVTTAAVTSTVGTLPASVSLQAVVADAEWALAAWGRFAATGDLAFVEPWFAADGPQLAQLRSEAADVAAAGRLGGAPYEFELTEPVVLAGEAGAKLIRSGVTVSRPGEVVQRYRWEIELHRSTEPPRWQVWTVKTVE